MSNDLVSKTLSPESIEEVCDAVRAHNHSAIYPIGAGSWMDLGYPRTKPGIEISTRQLNRVVDYPHEELTITVEAGIRISELAKILAEKGQMLPFDCPYPEKATLGGLLATNTSGPRRLAYGTARDSVLGLDVVNAQGERIHGGGRVVKNVAGYDMPKMHIGALGTLGIIVEATLKVRPMPEAVEWYSFNCDGVTIRDSLSRLRKSLLRPSSVEVDNPRGEKWRVSAAFEDCREAVEKQEGQIVLGMGLETSDVSFGASSDEAYRQLQSALNDLCSNAHQLSGRVSCKPTEIPRLLTEVPTEIAGAYLKVQPFTGVSWIFWNAANLQRAKTDIERIRSLAQFISGRFSIPRCPDEWKRELPIWGDIGPEIEWMRTLRNSLDPNHVINPGRFVVD